MRITALPAAFHRAANIRPPEISLTVAGRLRLLKMWRAIRAQGATAQRAADILHTPRASLYRWQARLDAATPAPNAPTPSASPKTTDLPDQATSSKWTRWTSAPSPA